MEQKDNPSEIPKKKKILFLSTKSVLGGAQRYIVDLVDYLPKSEFEMVVAGGGRGPLAMRMEERAVPYIELKSLQKNINILRDFVVFFEIMAVIRKVRPDILHLNSSKAAFLGAVAGRLLGVSRIVSSTHGWPFLEDRSRWERSFLKFLTKLGVLFQDKVICVSAFDYTIGIQERIAPKEKLIPIHNGIDSKKHVFLDRTQARDKLFARIDAPPKNYFIIGTIAEYTKNKGLYYLIEAAEHIMAVDPRILVVMIGWGEEKDFLEHHIRMRHLEGRVILADYVPEAFTYLKAFDIFILPSLKEGFAYTLLEAALAELPIIATEVGGNPEIVENLKTGLLVRPASPEEIINAVSHLARDAGDRTLFGTEARKKVVRDFSIASMIELTKKAYESA